MSVEVFKPIRWPIEIDSTNDTIELIVGGTPYTGTMTVGIYLIDGTGDASDLVELFKDECNAILTASGTGAALTSFAMTDDGYLSARASGSNVTINWAATNSLPASTFGYTGSTSVVSAVPLVSTFQADLQWLSGVCEAYDSDNVWRDIVTERRNLRGRPIRLSQGDADWLERVIDWRRVASGRIKDTRADDADYATVADVETGEDNTWENMWRYLKGAPGPNDDNRVYIYSENDASFAVREGPYEVILSESSPDLFGVGVEGYRQDESSEFFDVKLMLWGEAP